VPKALTALKYFNEDAPEYAIICAESLLGVARQKGTSFPVGEDVFLDLFPMTFDELMIALGKELFADLLQKRICFSRHLTQVQMIQKQILNAFEQAFSKHAPVEIVPRIRMLWHSIPAQLTKKIRNSSMACSRKVPGLRSKK